MGERKSRAKLVAECYLAMKNGKSFSKYSKVVRDLASERCYEDYKEKYGEEAYNELMQELEADRKRLGVARSGA